MTSGDRNIDLRSRLKLTAILRNYFWLALELNFCFLSTKLRSRVSWSVGEGKSWKIPEYRGKSRQHGAGWRKDDVKRGFFVWTFSQRTGDHTHEIALVSFRKVWAIGDLSSSIYDASTGVMIHNVLVSEAASPHYTIVIICYWGILRSAISFVPNKCLNW